MVFPLSLFSAFPPNVVLVGRRSTWFLAAACLWYSYTITGVLAQTPVLINEADYDSSIALGPNEEFLVFWTLNEPGNKIDFAVEAPTDGYVSIGFNPEDNGHLNCDMIVGWVPGSDTSGSDVEDYWSTTYARIDIDSTSNDVTDVATYASPGFTAMSFSRFIDVPTDPEDGDVALMDENGFLKLVWAYDDDDVTDVDAVAQHDNVRRGTVFANLVTGEISRPDPGPWGTRDPLTIHALTALTAWMGFMGLGSIAGASMAGDISWSVVHSWMQTSGMALAVAATTMGTWLKADDHFRSIHGMLGLGLTLILLSLPTLGATSLQRSRYASGSGLSDGSSSRTMHKAIAYLLLFGALVNSWFGLSLAGETSTDSILFQTWGSFVLLLLLSVLYSCLVSATTERVAIGVNADKRASFAKRTEDKATGKVSNTLPPTSEEKASGGTGSTRKGSPRKPRTSKGSKGSKGSKNSKNSKGGRRRGPSDFIAVTPGQSGRKRGGSKSRVKHN